ncbi:uncharacterized protein EI90DRAFT_3289411 [Cantharellus anzutake]|uniref:uncharacterized protein n=1 Tax=Cantharellus anzutake TaxID=1750568 RepID=UPI001904F156|nr:uncharacterized protein EI90DRAFT_3289411 [Cantharellus anzutake]KAF8331294.1 hypothetical protein EI90DRAFT_3289411 [Cantharellus anzutake]
MQASGAKDNEERGRHARAKLHRPWECTPASDLIIWLRVHPRPRSAQLSKLEPKLKRDSDRSNQPTVETSGVVDISITAGSMGWHDSASKSSKGCVYREGEESNGATEGDSNLVNPGDYDPEQGGRKINASVEKRWLDADAPYDSQSSRDPNTLRGREGKGERHKERKRYTKLAKRHHCPPSLLTKVTTPIVKPYEEGFPSSALHELDSNSCPWRSANEHEQMTNLERQDCNAGSYNANLVDNLLDTKTIGVEQGVEEGWLRVAQDENMRVNYLVYRKTCAGGDEERGWARQ